ncbi:HEAT repeat domain-containing protein [Candidatus Palauibacter sp.]|uniref:HEAT repeat domain-containing protein n=1 Tax=Candidatus Palauibacter sp. TaxID=3101350 RepID=UPI003B523D73
MAQTVKQTEVAAFLEARRAINAEEFARAAELFKNIRTESITSSPRFEADSYYWEAFARYRLGDLAEARLLLETLMIGFEEAQTGVGRYRETGRLYNDARALEFEIRSQLAARGDADETADLLREAESALDAESGFPSLRAAMIDDVESPDPLAHLATTMADSAIMEARDGADSPAAARRAQQEPLATALAETFYEVARAPAARADQTAAEYAEWATAYVREAVAEYPEPYRARTGQQEACEGVSVQLAALEALMRFDVNRMQILRGVLDREDDCSILLHDEVVGLIGQEATDEAQAVLLGVAQGHLDEPVRRAAVAELWRFDSYDAYLVLRSKLDAEDQTTRLAAVDGLGRSRYWATKPIWVGGALADVIADQSASLRLRRQAIQQLGRRDEVTDGQLITIYEEVASYADQDQVKQYLLDQLGAKLRRTGDEESAAWVFAIALDSSASEGVRGKAFDAWAEGTSADVAGLAQLYRDFTEPFMRRHAMYAIYRRVDSDSGAASTMMDLIRQETDADVRERGIYWLGRTGAEEAVGFLLEFLPAAATDTIPPPREGGPERC